MTPKDAIGLPFDESLRYLETIVGAEELKSAFDISRKISPKKIDKGANFSPKTLKTIGINPRLTKTFWGIVKYSMTFPEQGVHIMPLFESGDGSLYVQNSWRLNNDFLDQDLISLGYKTSSEQLKLVVNVLHSMGKLVGFDVLPHVDNFSEIVILNPCLFEWIKLTDNNTKQILPSEIDYNLLYKDVERVMIETCNLPPDFFLRSEAEKQEILFPSNSDRFEKRMKIRKAIRNSGYEPIPVVEHQPLRPILFDKIQKNGDESWASFYVPNMKEYSKIIGAITPYKWYKVDDKGHPLSCELEHRTWEYFIHNVSGFQESFDFDFYRADMAHNQISQACIDKNAEFQPVEFWKELKAEIRKNKPEFFTLAECFYGNYYITGIEDMINKDFDIVLGCQNFQQLESSYLNFIDDFLNPFRINFPFFPCVSVFTNDGDLPVHNRFFSSNKVCETRLFVALFLNLPSYMGIGFETRDICSTKEENYSNEYVRVKDADYEFGNNYDLYNSISTMRELYENHKFTIDQSNFELLCLDNNFLVWRYLLKDSKMLFCAVNLNKAESSVPTCGLDLSNAQLLYSNSTNRIEYKNEFITSLEFGDCCIYET